MPNHALSPLQEAFCRAYVLDPNGARAAVRAGYAPANARAQASRLLTKANIQRSIMLNRTEIAARHGADLDALMCKLEAVYRRAFESHQMSAAARAVEMQARIAGFLSSRDVRLLPTSDKDGNRPETVPVDRAGQKRLLPPGRGGLMSNKDKPCPTDANPSRSRS